MYYSRELAFDVGAPFNETSQLQITDRILPLSVPLYPAVELNIIYKQNISLNIFSSSLEIHF